MKDNDTHTYGLTLIWTAKRPFQGAEAPPPLLIFKTSLLSRQKPEIWDTYCPCQMEYNVMHGCRLAPPEAPKWPLQRAEGPPKTGYKLTMGDDGTQLHHTCFLPGNAGFTSQFETNSAYKLLLLFNPPSSQSPLVPPSSLESPQVPPSPHQFLQVLPSSPEFLKFTQYPSSPVKCLKMPPSAPMSPKPSQFPRR